MVATRSAVVTSAPSLGRVDSNSMVGIGAEAIPYTSVLAVVEEAVSDRGGFAFLGLGMNRGLTL
jgi:hypothetical protein